MPVVTVAINRELNSRDEAWLQIIDDINNANLDIIKYIVDNATLVKYGKFSSVASNIDNVNKDSYIMEVNNKFNEFATSNKLNETQLRNLKAKCNYWLNNDFKDIIHKLNNSTDKISLVLISDKITKHEWLMINSLNSVGVNILVVTKDINNILICRNSNIIKFGTDECIKLTNDNSSITNIKEFKQLKEISKEFLIENNICDIIANRDAKVRISILGTDVNMDSLQLAAKLHDFCKSDDKSFFIDNKISVPTIDETSKIYRITRDNVDYIIHTMKNFIKCHNKKLESLAKDAFVSVINDNIQDIKNSSILYNKCVSIICWLNRYLVKDGINIIYYGNPRGNDKLFIDIISKIDAINIIIINAESLTEGYRFIDGDTGYNIVLNSKTNNINLDLVATNTSTTIAYKASKMLDQTLFNGDTIGLCREGQIIGCNTSHLACTFDEIALWWNKEMVIRPGFKQYKNTVDIPVQFGVIRGVKDSESEYRRLIQKYCCGKTRIYYGNNFSPKYDGSMNTMRIHNCTDINRTRFCEQKPFIVGGKLQTELIKQGKNYKYGFLDKNKQDFILSKIQEIIDDKMLLLPNHYNYKKSKLLENDFYDMLLDMTLNLDIELLRTIQWFNYTDYNPNIVVISNNEDILTFEDVLYLRFMNKLGFDILVFVPTQYTSVEGYLNSTEYEIYNIGRPEYHLDLSNINVIKDANYAQKQDEKKSWLSKFFKQA